MSGLFAFLCLEFCEFKLAFCGIQVCISNNQVCVFQNLSLYRKNGLYRRDGAVVRALAFHQCVPGSITGPGVICELSLLLVLYSALRGFSPGTPVFPSPQKPTFPNSNSIWNCQALYHEPLARVIAQVLPVFDIKIEFTFTIYNLQRIKFVLLRTFKFAPKESSLRFKIIKFASKE